MCVHYNIKKCIRTGHDWTQILQKWRGLREVRNSTRGELKKTSPTQGSSTSHCTSDRLQIYTKYPLSRIQKGLNEIKNMYVLFTLLILYSLSLFCFRTRHAMWACLCNSNSQKLEVEGFHTSFFCYYLKELLGFYLYIIIFYLYITNNYIILFTRDVNITI